MKTYLLSFLAGLTLGAAAVFALTSPSMAPTEEPSIPESDNEPASQLSISYVNTNTSEVTNLNIEAGDTINAPLTMTGEAIGSWFFEATAPVTVVDWNGLIIGEGYIEATAPWMTENLVPFTGIITFTANTTVSNAGAIILKNANASGLPQFDKYVEIPINFSQ